MNDFPAARIHSTHDQGGDRSVDRQPRDFQVSPKMNKVGIAFSTKDRVELSRRTIEPLLQPDKFDLYWNDGSNLPEAQEYFQRPFWSKVKQRTRVTGGADAAIVFGLSQLLVYDYDYVGLVENDVLLHPDWFGPTMALFERAKAEELEAGAVSARSYEDRVLIQRDGYAVMHNLGAGMVIYTRKAAELILQHFRTSMTTENRRVFSQLTGMDIGRYWAFRTSENWLCADWGFDRVLAQHGLASLALTPACCEMIGQVPPLHEQGLKLVERPVELLRDEKRFKLYRENMDYIRLEQMCLGAIGERFFDGANHTLFAHQFRSVGAYYNEHWRLKWVQGFGPFAFQSVEGATLDIQLFGHAGLLVSGGAKGGTVSITDETGYKFEPFVSPDPPGQIPVTVLHFQSGMDYRRVTATFSPGMILYGATTREPQPHDPSWRFDYSVLPPVEG